MTKKLSLLLSVLILSFGFGYFIFAWTEPGSTPPDGNVPAPINVGPTTQTKTGGLNLGGDLTVSGGDIAVSKEGNYSSIYFPAQTNDPGYVQHYESSNTGRLYLMPGDDWSSTDAVIVKGTDEAWAHELRTDGWLGVASGIYDRTDGTLNVSDSLSVTGNLTASGRHLYLGSQDIYGDNSSALYWDSNHDTVTQMILRDRQNTIYGRVYGSGDGVNFGLLSADGSWAVRATNSGTQIYHDLTVSGNATVAGQNVCRQNGVNCPTFSTNCASCDSRFINVGESGDSIADNTIDSSEIQDNTLTASDLAPNSCGNSELIDSPTFTTLYVGSYGDIYSDSSWLRLNQNHTQNIYTPRIIRADGGFQVDGTTVIGGDAWVEGDRIRQNTIDGSEIQDNTLTASDLAANSCGNSELIDNPTFNNVNVNGTLRLSWQRIQQACMTRMCKATCSSGYIVVGGGCEMHGGTAMDNRPEYIGYSYWDRRWVCYGKSDSSEDRVETTYAICLRIQQP